MNQVDFNAILLSFLRSKLIGLCQASQCKGSRTEVQKPITNSLYTLRFSSLPGHNDVRTKDGVSVKRSRLSDMSDCQIQ